MTDTFMREVSCSPAFDRRNTDPAKDCGLGGVTLYFVLKGKHGAINFTIYTNWHLPLVQEEFDAKPLGRFPYMFHKPMAADLGRHSPKPMYEGETPMRDSCDFLDGKPCYYDGSTLDAEPVFKELLRGGSDAVWKILEARYESLFGKDKP